MQCPHRLEALAPPGFRRANMRELLELALRAHGGLGRWREVQSLDVRVSLTGALYRLRATRKVCPTSP
jgi:hypothetical protein